MKRTALLLVVFILTVHTAWAAGRAKINSIARDPYVSALVIDADTGKILFSENPETVVFPASVIKLMNLLVILERVEQGALKLEDMVQVTNEAAKTGGSQVYLDPKEQFSVDDLLYALAVQSANDAAVALASHVAGSKEGFVALMNQKAAELGMKNTRIYSVHGLPPAEGQKPDVTTASDLALLCRALASRPDAMKYTGTKERGFRDNKFIMRNHNHLLGQVDGCDGFKTGYYEVAGFSIAATAKRGGVRIISIVMGSKDRKVRDAKASELMAKGFAMTPPQPEAAVAVSKPAAPTPIKIEPPAPQPAAPQPLAPVEKEKTVVSSGGGWGMFFLGLGAGLIIFIGIFAFFMSRNRARGKRR